jgi:mannose-6-phosphate isomerase-like protein (cupin superfamily)
MRYVRPFHRDVLAPGGADWLLSPAEDVGCSIQLRRGGLDAVAQESRDERFALVLSGEVKLMTPEQETAAAQGDIIFIPVRKNAAITGGSEAFWIEVAAPAAAETGAGKGEARVMKVDQSRFEGQGFAYQSLVDRSVGATTMRINVLQVQPGSGSPDYHIHAFAQIYVIQEGEMTIDVGRQRFQAGQDTLVLLPAGVVHRNFNAAAATERHMSLLVPEPRAGEIFDFAVTIHDKEAELIGQVPH